MRLLLALSALLLPFALRAQVVINEVMYAPDPHEPEWVELYNAGSEAIALDGWRIYEDSNSTASGIYATIGPNEYLVVARDSARFVERWGEVDSPVTGAIFSYLNNSGGDCVKLRGANGELQDEVCYGDLWGGKSGRSLERKGAICPSNDSASWGTSVDATKGTPGRANSITGCVTGVRDEAFVKEELDLVLER